MTLPSKSFFLLLGFTLLTACEKPPELIDWVVVESAYGPLFDDIEGLTSIEDAADWHAEVDRLNTLIAADPTVVALLTSSKHFLQFQDSRRLMLSGERMSGTCSSLTGAFWNNNHMMVCKKHGKKTGSIKTLHYERRSILNGELTFIVVQLGYDILVERYDPDTVRDTTIGSEDQAKQYDDYLLGSWLIQERLTSTIDEERRQTGKLYVGPRLSFGSYAVRAEFHVDSSLRRKGAKFANSKCQMAKGSCQFDATVNGKLRIVNSKVRIVFESAKWGTDVLTISSGSMIGRNNNFGTTVRLKRETT